MSGLSTSDPIDFFRQLPAHSSNAHHTVFRDYNIPLKDIDHLKVVTNMEWPIYRGVPASIKKISEIQKLSTISGRIFRIKEFFDRRLAKPMKLIEIKVACVEMTFSLPNDVSILKVRRSMEILRANGRLYDLIEVRAHIDGKKVD